MSGFSAEERVVYTRFLVESIQVPLLSANALSFSFEVGAAVSRAFFDSSFPLTAVTKGHFRVVQPQR